MSSPKRQKTEDKAEETKQVYTLYSYWRSSCSWRVRIALNLKGLEYEYKAVHLVQDGGHQLKEDYAKLNAMKEVPTLMVGDKPLGQSMAIINYLEDAHPRPALLPSDVFRRAKARQLAEIISSDTQPVQNLRVIMMIQKKLGAEEKVAWGKHWIENGLLAMEREVKQTAGKYCLGDSVTVADLALVPQLYNARRFKCDMAQFPTLLKIEKELESLEAFKKAHPSVQPDAQ